MSVMLSRAFTVNASAARQPLSCNRVMSAFSSVRTIEPSTLRRSTVTGGDSMREYMSTKKSPGG